MPRILAFFHSSAMGNSAIQLLLGMGIPSDRLGVTPPEGIEGGQGMVLSIACPEARRSQVENACRNLGAQVHRQPI